jgi:putative SOS response-associated peptidase YedK
MCGRFTNRLTWREIVALYRLSVLATPERNLPARYNICPTDTIDAVIEREGRRELVPMRWGLVASWWKKKAKEAPATFNARAETVAEKPVFRSAFKQSQMLDPCLRLLRVAKHADRQTALLLHSARRFTADICRTVG